MILGSLSDATKSNYSSEDERTRFGCRPRHGTFTDARDLIQDINNLFAPPYKVSCLNVLAVEDVLESASVCPTVNSVGQLGREVTGGL